jgi:hypothetical protein
MYEFDPLEPGDPRTVGGYALRARIGAGGMGRVYLSFTPGGRAVALKIIRAEFGSDPEFRERFAREVSIAQQVNGIHIAQLIDAGSDNGAPWLASAYVAGPSLAQVIGAHGPLPAHTVLALAGRIAESLGAIHATGMVHRDLKPGNILLDESGPKVIDFGIVRAAAPTATGRSSHRTFIGSPPFMAPEQIRGQKITPATDVFALGATLYWLCTGEGAFQADFADGVLYRVIHDEPDYGACPEQVRELIRVCLRKDPAQRPSTRRIVEGCRAAGAGPETPLPDAVRAMIRERAGALERLKLTGPQGVAGRRDGDETAGETARETAREGRARETADGETATEGTTADGAGAGRVAAGGTAADGAGAGTGAAGWTTADGAGAGTGAAGGTTVGETPVGETAAEGSTAGESSAGAAVGAHAGAEQAGRPVRETADGTNAGVGIAAGGAAVMGSLGETGGEVAGSTRAEPLATAAGDGRTPLLPPQRGVHSMTTVTPEATPVLDLAGGPAAPRRTRRGRTALAAVTSSLVTAVVAVVVAVLIWPHSASGDNPVQQTGQPVNHSGSPSSNAATSAPAAPTSPASSAALSGSNVVRFQGQVLITANEVDLDSVPVDNGASSQASVYDSSTGLGADPYQLSALPYGSATLATWTGSSTPDRTQCYDQVATQGVNDLPVTNGTMVCVITAQDRVALIKVVDDQADNGEGIMADVTVWSGVISTASATAS